VPRLSGEDNAEPPPPVEVVGVRGPAVPLPFTTAPVAPPPRSRYVADRDGTWIPARLPHVRRYVRAGRWDGALTLGEPPKDISEDDGQARYGLALLAVTCLAKRFGEDRMLEFFAAVARDRSTPDAASPGVLGTDWAPVAADCIAQIRARAA
jgi:hypothetical protein